MRKFSKLLAVLLTVCVLCGVVATFAVSANDEDLTPTLKYATGLGTANMIDNNGTSINSESNSRYKLGTLRETGMGYVKVYPKATEDIPTGYDGAHPYAGLTLNMFHNGSAYKQGVAGRDDFGTNTEGATFMEYMTVDMDFGVDSYRYVYVDEYGKTVKTIDATAVENMTEVDSLADISDTSYFKELAMPENYYGRFETFYGNTEYSTLATHYIRQDENGDWYVCSNSTVKESIWKYKLAGEVGKYDHFTWVWRVIDSDPDSLENDLGLQVYFYVNGEYVDKPVDVARITHRIKVDTNGDGEPDTNQTFSAHTISIKRYYYSYTKADFKTEDGNTTMTTGEAYASFAWRNDYSFQFKNIAMNYYTPEDLEKTTLDEFIEGTDYNTTLFGVTNIVANENYVTPNYKDGYVEYGGKTFYFTALGLAYAADEMKSGETLTVSGVSVKDFVPKGNVANFFVKCLNGATFTTQGYDKYDYTDTSLDLYIIDESNISGYDRLNITNDAYNRYNDYSTSSTDTTGRLGSTVVNDGDHTNGLKHTYSTGYQRIFTDGGKYHNATYALMAWTLTHNDVSANNWKSNILDTSYAVIDLEFGTDSYVFSYTADTVRTIDQSGSKITASNTTETLVDQVFYKMVSSKAEFDAFVANPASLETTISTTHKNGSKYTYTQTDVLSNVRVDDKSFTLALGSGIGGVGIASNWLYAATADYYVDGKKAERDDCVNYKAYVVQDPKTGLWYMSDSSGAYSAENSNVLLSNEVGVTDHISIVFDNGHIEAGKLTYIVYVNGEYLSSAVFSGTKSGDKDVSKLSYLSARGVGVYLSGTQKVLPNYSIMVDDLGFNWYRDVVSVDTENTETLGVGKVTYNEYTSGDLYGIDDLVADFKAGNVYPITKALDVYFNETLITKDGWVSVDNGKTVLVSPTQIAEALNNVTDYAEIITSRKLTITSLPEGVFGLYIRPVRNGGVILAGELKNTHVVADYMDGLLDLRPLLDREKLNVIFKDEDGNVYHTTVLTPGTELVPPAYRDNTFNPATGEVLGFVKWVIEGTDTDANGYSYSGYVQAGAELVVVPVVEKKATLNAYALYRYDSEGIAYLYGDVDLYSEFSVAKVNEALALLSKDDKAILTLLYDGVVDLGGGAKFATIKSHLTFDLNGRTLVFSKDYAGTGYGDYPFTIGDGAFLNLISSKPGGEIYMARDSGGGKNEAWANGIIQLGSGVNNATINVGAYDANGNKCEDYAGNFSLYGGSLAFLGGGGATPAEATVTLNVNGAEFYHALRSGYAVVVGRYNDLYVNFYNSKFYSNSSVSYGIYHDYSASSYSTKSIIKAYDCEFYAASNSSIELDGTSDFAIDRPIFKLQANSSIYLEGCKLVGSNNSFAQGQVTLGPDNLIAGLDASKVALAEGVSMLDLEGAYISGEFTHPPMFFKSDDYDTLVDDGKGGLVMNPDILNKDNWITTGTSCGNAFMTYSSDKDAPAYEIANVELYTADGKLCETLPWLVGEKFYASVDKIQENFYFIYDLAWATEGGEAVEGTVVNAPLKAYIAGATTYFQGISAMQANLTLKSDMKFNLYIPERDGIDVNGVSLGNILPNLFTIGDKQYYVVVIDLTAGNFDAFKIDVYLLAEDKYTGETYEFVDNLTIDYVKSYASIAAKDAHCGSETAILLKEIIDYNVAVAKYLDASFDEAAVESIAAFRKIYADHNVADDPATEDVDESKSCVCGVELPEAEATDLSGVASYITDATYYLDSNVGVMGLILYVAEGYDGADLTVSFVDVDGKEVFAEVEYIADKGYIVVSNIKAAYIDDVMTVTIGEAVGTYSLATYIAECEDANAEAVAGALLEYSIAAEAYKASLRAE